MHSTISGPSAVFALLLAGFCLLISNVFVHFEHPIYFWDYSGYWTQFIELSAALTAAPGDYFRLILRSIRWSDYNNAIIVPLTLLSPMTGTGRATFLSLLTLVYLVPFALVFAALCNRFSNQILQLPCDSRIPACLCIACIPFWNTILRGQPDIAGLLPLLLLLSGIFCLATDRIDYRHAIWIGLGVWASFLARRYYIFAIVPISMLAPALILHQARTRQEKFLPALKYLTLNLLMAFALFLILALCFQNGLIRQIVKTSYSNIYDAYQIDFISHINSLISRTGYMALALSLLGGGILLSSAKTMAYGLYAIFCMGLTFFMFIHVQRFEMHHFLMIAFWLLMLQSVALCWLVRKFRRPGQAVAALFIAVNFIMPWLAGNAVQSPLVPEAVQPLRRHNIAEYDRLARDLVQMQVDRLAILGSGHALIDEMLPSLSDQALRGALVQIPHVDKRDRILPDAFTASHVVIADPIPLHLPRGQQLLQIYRDYLLELERQGNYARLPQIYHLDQGVQAFILRREKPISRQQLLGLIEKIFAIYPEWRSDYDFDQLLQAFSTGA